jgi:hypothetical protein
LSDLNAIKWRTPLGTSLDTAYFAWTFIADQNPPLLLKYHLDMNTLLDMKAIIPLSPESYQLRQRTTFDRNRVGDD